MPPAHDRIIRTVIDGFTNYVKEMTASEAGDFLALAHWRRTVAEMYAEVRQEADHCLAWERFIAARNELFKSHPQSPLTPGQQSSFQALSYFPYDPAFCTTGRLEPDVSSSERSIELATDGAFRLRRIAAVRFEIKGQPSRLSLYWVQGYGGGLFLPFRDETNKTMTYGGGRYLYDTIKGADLGARTREIVLDFNFGYNPSCAYDDRWVCPLPPAENSLTYAVAAGEKRF